MGVFLLNIWLTLAIFSIPHLSHAYIVPICSSNGNYYLFQLRLLEELFYLMCENILEGICAQLSSIFSFEPKVEIDTISSDDKDTCLFCDMYSEVPHKVSLYLRMVEKVE